MMDGWDVPLSNFIGIMNIHMEEGGRGREGEGFTIVNMVFIVNDYVCLAQY